MPDPSLPNLVRTPRYIAIHVLARQMQVPQTPQVPNNYLYMIWSEWAAPDTYLSTILQRLCVGFCSPASFLCLDFNMYDLYIKCCNCSCSENKNWKRLYMLYGKYRDLLVTSLSEALNELVWDLPWNVSINEFSSQGNWSVAVYKYMHSVRNKITSLLYIWYRCCYRTFASYLDVYISGVFLLNTL